MFAGALAHRCWAIDRLVDLSGSRQALALRHGPAIAKPAFSDLRTLHVARSLTSGPEGPKKNAWEAATDSADVAEANLQEPKAIQGMILTLQVTDCDFNRSALDQVAKPAAILQHRHRSKIVAERRCRRESQQHVFPICGG